MESSGCFLFENKPLLSVIPVSSMSRRLSSLPFRSEDVSQVPTLWLKSSSLKPASLPGGGQSEWPDTSKSLAWAGGVQGA